MKKRFATCAVAIASLVKPGRSYSTTIPAKPSFRSSRNFKKSESRSTDRSRRGRYEPSISEQAPSDARTAEKNTPGWHRRVLRKVFHRGSKSDHLNMQTVAAADDTEFLLADQQQTTTRFQDDDFFLRQSFELTSPEDIFPQEPDSLPALVEVSTKESQKVMDDVAAAVEETTNHMERGSPYTRITRAWFQNILSQRLDRWSTELTNLSVQCQPKGNIVKLARGIFHCDASIDFDRAVFANIRLSGGNLEVKNFALNLYKGLAPSSGPRYPNQFVLVAKNSTFTQKDLLESSCIRNGLRRLASRILKNRGIVAFATEIKSIKIMPGGKFSCVGEAATLFGPPVLFEVRSGIDFTSRGHILTFPGLELSVGPSLGRLFVPITPEVTVDMGHNAQLLDLKIDPIAEALTLSAHVTITPEHTILLKDYQQSSSAYGALCSVDVGRWLTRLGRFTH